MYVMFQCRITAKEGVDLFGLSNAKKRKKKKKKNTCPMRMHENNYTTGTVVPTHRRWLPWPDRDIPDYIYIIRVQTNGVCRLSATFARVGRQRQDVIKVCIVRSDGV